MNNLEASKVLEGHLLLRQDIKLRDNNTYILLTRNEIDKAIAHALSLLKTECKLVPEEKDIGKILDENPLISSEELNMLKSEIKGFNLCRSLVLQNWIGVKGRSSEIAKVIYDECFDFGKPKHHGDCTNEPQSCMWCLCLNAADKLTDFIEKGK